MYSIPLLKAAPLIIISSDKTKVLEKFLAANPEDREAAEGFIRSLVGLSSVRLREGSTQASVALSSDALLRAADLNTKYNDLDAQILLA